MKKYRVPIRFVFKGHVDVEANSKKEARSIVNENVWAGNPFIGSHKEEVVDWEINLHSEREFGLITLIKDNEKSNSSN